MNTHYRVHITLYMKIPHTSNTSMAQTKGGATRDSGTSRFGSALVGKVLWTWSNCYSCHCDDGFIVLLYGGLLLQLWFIIVLI